MKNILLKFTNENILINLQSGLFIDWEYLYDNFSPLIYGAILKITDNKEIANQILLDVFVSLKTTKFIGISLVACLLKSTKLVAAQNIEANNLSVFKALADLVNPSKTCNLPGVY